MRTLLEKLRRSEELQIIKEEVSPEIEITNFIKDTEKSFLFENISGFPKFRIASNIITTRKKFSTGLGCREEELLEKINNSLEKRITPKTVDSAPCMESTCRFSELPIPTYFNTDGGPYITSAVIVSHDLEYGYNLSFHRMMKRDDHLMIRLVKRHTWEFYEKSGRNLDIVICIGCEPAVLAAGAVNTEIGVNELEIAGALKGAPIEVCKFGNMIAPANCEIAIEATLTSEWDDEGPFVDITRTFDFVRKQPLVRIKKIHCRKDPIFHALLPGGLEHGVIWKTPTEAVMLNRIRKVCDCRDVFLSFGGCSRLHGIAKIKKKAPHDGRNAIEAAFDAHKSMKHFFVVDDDIDIKDPSQIEWALATRFQAKNDLLIRHDEIGSTLDPSSEDGITSKLGFDCTIKGEKEKFRKIF